MRRAASGFLLLTALAVAATAGLRQWREWRESGLTIRWDEKSGLFDWGPASVRLPSGFLHRRLQGCDTLMGEFISPGGRVIVNYDIGELAGEHGGIGSFTEVLRGGSRVCRDQARAHRSLTTAARASRSSAKAPKASR